jgi:hypothetical protein
MLWLLTAVTMAVLVFIVVMIRDIARTPTAAGPAALAAKTRTVSHATASGSARQKAAPRPEPAPSVSHAQVTDTSSGLTYWLLSPPWRRGCPSALNTPMFGWSAGENAVAGQVTVGGSTIDWHGLACSGQLQQQFQYSGPADLEPAAMGLAGAFDPVYYSGLRHYRTLESSSAMRVSGHQAWVVTFLITYPDAAGQGLTWTSEAGAVVVVDRGAGRAPAIFYVSVPGNLGVTNVNLLISSLRLG